MEQDVEGRVYDRLATGQTRYTYFILAAAASGVALAVNRTTGAALAYSHLLIGLAVVAWGFSFFFGCLHLGYVNASLAANLELFRIRRGRHPDVGGHPDIIQAASEGALDAFEFNSTRANRYGHLQFGLLIVGALLFLAWHVQTMYSAAEGSL